MDMLLIYIGMVLSLNIYIYIEIRATEKFREFLFLGRSGPRIQY